MSKNEIQKKQMTASDRFMNKIMAEFNSTPGDVAVSDFQKRLIQNYFIAVDGTLKNAENKRNSNKNDLPYSWNNVHMDDKFSRSIVAAARIGLDPAQDNHIHIIPYKNNSVKKYDMVLMDGYRGLELKSMKYGRDIPDHVVVELVYSNDKFKTIKKDKNNPYESYEFEIVNDFDRGDVIGGFYYHIYSDKPEKNKLVVFNLKEIEKRKPKYAANEFWGKDNWYEKMCWKTIYRAAYKDITIDSEKIDENYLALKQMETEYSEKQIEEEIETNANTETLDFEDAQDADYQEVPEEEPEEEPDFEGTPFEKKEGPGF